mmetsp:Transcript_8217/g.14060  ORF Transcript_8217/g.14060 Transcript_8217/m.14060 type:complete len:332 (-) Transcript_8217:150-1145(-)
MDHRRNRTAGGGFDFCFGGRRGERHKLAQGVLLGLLAMVLALERPLALVVVLHPAFEPRARVAELEAEAVRKRAQVDRARVRDVMELGIKIVHRWDGHGHVGVGDALRVGQRASDPLDAVIRSLVGIDGPDVEHQHLDDRVPRSASNQTVSDHRVRLVLRVRLVRDDKPGVLATLDNGSKVLLKGNHVRVNVHTTMFVENFQTQQIRLALVHLLLVVEIAIEHLHAGNFFIGPELVTPFWIVLQVTPPPRIKPDAWWFLRTDPDLMNYFRNGAASLDICLGLRFPLVGIRLLNSALSRIPVVEATDGSQLYIKGRSSGIDVIVRRHFVDKR